MFGRFLRNLVGENFFLPYKSWLAHSKKKKKKSASHIKSQLPGTVCMDLVVLLVEWCCSKLVAVLLGLWNGLV